MDVGIIAMMTAHTSQGQREVEIGARFSCHLLMMLFESVGNTAPNRTQYGSGIKLR